MTLSITTLSIMRMINAISTTLKIIPLRLPQLNIKTLSIVTLSRMTLTHNHHNNTQ